MNKIDILIEGYATVTDTGWVASGTTTFITSTVIPAKAGIHKNKIPGQARDDNGDVIHIIVDPGANREKLLEKLAEKSLQLDDIEYVFLTHLHLDHSLLMGIFSKAKIINHEAITFGEKGELVPAMIPGTDISIIKTPGHEYAGASLLVPTKDGTVGIVGDVFWWEEGEEQKIDINKPDDFATDMNTLIQSRKEVLKLADWIIPGHGTMMKVQTNKVTK